MVRVAPRLQGSAQPLMIQKSDGGYGYATTDMAAVKQRLHDEKADWVIYVTDEGQSSHFKLVFAAARKAGYLAPDGPRLDHVGFGLVLGDDGKRFRTRSSEVCPNATSDARDSAQLAHRVLVLSTLCKFSMERLAILCFVVQLVKLVDLLDEAKRRCKATIQEKRGDEFTEEELDISSAVMGYAAVKYADLKNARLTNYKFNFDDMLNLKGNTAVYLLYAHARIASIVRKSGKDIKGESFCHGIFW
jgi:arginyl-tRNA synthetase